MSNEFVREKDLIWWEEWWRCKDLGEGWSKRDEIYRLWLKKFMYFLGLLVKSFSSIFNVVDFLGVCLWRLLKFLGLWLMLLNMLLSVDGYYGYLVEILGFNIEYCRFFWICSWRFLNFLCLVWIMLKAVLSLDECVGFGYEDVYE